MSHQCRRKISVHTTNNKVHASRRKRVLPKGNHARRLRDSSALSTWHLPADSTIDKYRFTYSDWPGDGDAQVLARVGQATLKDLMSLPAFVWKAWPPDDGLLLQVHGLPTFNATHFRAEHVLPNDDWHRGKIVMVNTNTGEVCGYSWKY